MSRRIVLLLIVSLFLFSGCASTKLVSSWTQPGFGGPPLKHILVLAVSDHDMLRRLYEDAFVTKLQEAGADAVASYTLIKKFDNNEEKNKELIRAAVAKTGVDGVLITTLAGVENEKHYVPGSTVYVSGRGSAYGAYGMYGYYGYSHGFIHQPGYTVNNKTVKLHTAIFSVKTEEMLWAGGTQSLNPDSDTSVIHDSIEVINTSIKKAGLL